MKKRTLLPFLLIAGSLAALTSCGNNQECSSCPSCDDGSSAPAHTHTKATGYSYDENGHYHACEGCEENIRFDYEAHTIVEKDGVKTCSVCGYIPNDSMHKAFASLQKGIKAYASDTTSSVTGSMTMSSLKNDAAVMTVDIDVKTTVDVENASLYIKQTQSTKYYGSDGNVAYSATGINETAYAKDDNSNVYYYKGSDDSKKYYLSDQGMCKRTFEDGYSLDDSFYEYILQAKSYEVFQEMLETDVFYQTYLREYKAEQSAKTIDGGYEYTIYMENMVLDEYGEKNITSVHIVYTIKNDYLVAEKFENSEIKDYKYGDKEETKMATSVEMSSDFNQTFYSTFDKTNYTDSGEGQITKFNVYYDDYKISQISTSIGKTLDNYYKDGGVAVGDYYYDKELTKPYNGEAITGDVGAIYLKPTVKDGEYGKVIYLIEAEYIDPCGVFDPIYKRDYVEAKDIATGSSYSVDYKTDDDSNNVGEIYVNGQLSEDNSITVEKGKIYIIEYKYVEYMTSPFHINS